MRVDLYTILRNEEKILPYYLRHYSQFVDKIFVFDDDSTDRTKEILSQNSKVTILKPEMHGIDDHYFRSLYATAFRTRSKGAADWVICVDADEIIYHPDILSILQKCKNEGFSIIKCEGWTMFSDSFPQNGDQIYDEIKTGVPDVWQGKPVILSPEINIKFHYGRHNVYLLEEGLRIAESTGIKLLHYRYLGDQYCEERHLNNTERLSEKNRRGKLGRHNFKDSNYIHGMKWYRQNKNLAVNCID